MNTTQVLSSLAVIATITGSLCAQTAEIAETTASAPTAPAAAKKDIMALIGDSAKFSTLTAAIKSSGLDVSLRGGGPFTLFAPTNEAFEALPEGMAVKLLEPANQAQLVAILSYHVVPKIVLSGNATPMSLATAGGKQATITVDGGTVMIDAAKVTEGDIIGTNGVIHAIDKVLIPPVGETEAEPVEIAPGE